MIKLSSVNVGELIKIAYDMTDVNQVELNALDQLFQVKKKYEMSPFYVIVTRYKPAGPGIVCLWPDTLVLRPYENLPKNDAVLARAELPPGIRKIVGFKVNDAVQGQRRLSDTHKKIMEFVTMSGRRHLLIGDLQGIVDRVSVTLGQRIATPAKSIGLVLTKARYLTVVWEYTKLSQRMIEHGLTRSYHDYRESAENFIRNAKNEVLVGEVVQQEQDNRWNYEENHEKSCEFDGDQA